MTKITDTMRGSFEDAKNALMAADRVVIISHRGPDGDAVGANLALRLVLERLGKQVVSACVDPIPADSKFLAGAEDYVTDFEYKDFDVIVTVDCAAKKMVQFFDAKPELASGQKPFINIDHHESNNGFGTINIVDGEACATCYMLYYFFQFCEWKISVDIATCLLHGIYFDTGSLMHSNTDEDVMRVSGRLMEKGANLKRIVKELFHTTPINQMRLWGRILERTYVNEEGVTVSAVDHTDYEATGATSKDTSGAIDYLNSVPGSKYCVLLSEGEGGIVKGSLRTQRDDVNLSDIAGKWGGGGHPKASGFGMKGKLKPVMSWRILPGDEDKGRVDF